MDPETAEVKASGGVVWRRGERGIEIALIHRPRYDDWSFPKGKLDAGETWEDCALREVEVLVPLGRDAREWVGSRSLGLRLLDLRLRELVAHDFVASSSSMTSKSASSTTSSSVLPPPSPEACALAWAEAWA